MSVKIYVEGGGDHNKALQTRCRQGFSKFLERSGLRGHMPRVVACGGRSQAFDSFRTSLQNARPGEHPLLLVDSEDVVQGTPWEHVRIHDSWDRPVSALDEQLHFMVQAMEAWFHADKNTLERYYGDNFHPGALSQRQDVDNIPKRDLFTGLQAATRDCQKGEYSKGDHSFEILARIDPARVRNASPNYGARFLDKLSRACLE